MAPKDTAQRHMTLFGATSVGVGAIVGGGILALAGVAFAATGPSALVAFGLNGVIALLTAMSFAEMSSKFPQSGGTYTFAKKVLSVESAFAVGWVVWFASIVAGVLYAIGFGAFASAAVGELYAVRALEVPAWLTNPWTPKVLALAATAYFTMGLLRRSAGGGQFTNIAKVIVFAIVIAGGLWAIGRRAPADWSAGLRPFFSEGGTGLLRAMGFSFIALQGFDLIAAVAGEVREPERNLPRAMFWSLGIALTIYLPLLFIIATVGMSPGASVTEAGKANPETIVALAAQNFLGPLGYWLVMTAGVLSMLSALQANLFAASRVALVMARDRSLPRRLGIVHPKRQTPTAAVMVTAIVVALTVVLLPGVAAAGAASSLIFLVTFAIVHWIAILVRQRSVNRPPPFRSPAFPLVPVLGGVACAGLAIFQGIAVPSAGTITVTWLSLGGILFLVLFARRARVVDASASALDPELIQLRGKRPLALVPVANPENAGNMIEVANALIPPRIGRVVLLTVIAAPEDWRPDVDPRPLQYAQSVLAKAIAASAEAGIYPETLTTVAPRPWEEISRVAKVHACESLLLGLSKLSEDAIGSPLEKLISSVDCDIVVLRSRPGWRLSEARRILVPVGGRGGHDRLLARLIGSLGRDAEREVVFLRVLPANATAREQVAARLELQHFANDQSLSHAETIVVASASPAEEVARRADESDLVILGVQRVSRRQKLLGNFTQKIARATDCPILMISSRG